MNPFKKSLIEKWIFYGGICMDSLKEYHEKERDNECLYDACNCYIEFRQHYDDYKRIIKDVRREKKYVKKT